MLTTQNSVFLHVPKTAGVWVRDVLKPITQSFVMHEIPQTQPNRDHVFMFARNPWDWYVSYYQFHISGSETFDNNPTKSAALAALSELSFSEFIKCVNEPTDKYRKRARIFMRINHDLDHDFDTAETVIYRSWVDSDASYFQHMYNLYSRYTTKIGTIENIQQDLVDMLYTSGDFSPELVHAVLNNGPVNVTYNKPDYRSYYSDDLIDIVARNNQQIITDHGYKFE